MRTRKKNPSTGAVVETVAANTTPTINIPSTATPEAVQKLTRDLKNAAKLMGVREARYFVHAYYDLQDYRIASANQQRRLLEGNEPSEFMGWLNSVVYVSALSLWALVSGHWSAWQAARVEVAQDRAARELAKQDIPGKVVEAIVEQTDVSRA